MLALVVGSDGFIGRNVVLNLVKAGVGVIELDRKHTVTRGLGRVTANAQSVWPLVSCFDLIVLSASEPNVWDSDTHVDIEHEARICSRAIEYCKTSGSKRIVHFSSSNIYGSAPHPFKESGEVQPCNDYGRQKQLAETVLRNHGVDGLSVLDFRISNAIGKYQRSTMFPYIIVDSIIKNKPINVYGTRRRGWTPVDDIAWLVTSMMFSAWLREDAAPYEVYNFGPTKAHTQDQLIEAVYDRMTAFGDYSPPQVVRKDARPYEIPDNIMDPYKFRAAFSRMQYPGTDLVPSIDALINFCLNRERLKEHRKDRPGG